MDKLKRTEGVEFTSDGAQQGRQGNVWGAAIGGGLGGGLIGYAIGQNAKRNNYMQPQPQPYYPYPYPPQPQPYYGSSCGCSENQLVNRYELQQAERAKNLNQNSPRKKAERYAWQRRHQHIQGSGQLFWKNMERRDRLSADLAAAVG